METNKNYKKWQLISKIVVYTFLTIIAIMMLIPFYWMILTALKPDYMIHDIPPKFFFLDLRWDNFPRALSRAPFGKFYMNNLVVAIVSTIGTLVTTVLAAFAFARLKFFGRDVIFMILLSTMMIPGEMLVITNYLTISILHLKNTFTALIVPFMTSVFYIFFLRQTFKQIPDELYLAAKVDGTSDFKYLWKIMIPIAKPTIITIIILNMIGSFNAYVWPSLVTSYDKINNIDLRLVTNGLQNAFTSDIGTDYNLQLAASAVITLPMLIVFFLLKKYIMRGVSRSGIKG